MAGEFPVEENVSTFFSSVNGFQQRRMRADQPEGGGGGGGGGWSACYDRLERGSGELKKQGGGGGVECAVVLLPSVILVIDVKQTQLLLHPDSFNSLSGELGLRQVWKPSSSSAPSPLRTFWTCSSGKGGGEAAVSGFPVTHKKKSQFVV